MQESVQETKKNDPSTIVFLVTIICFIVFLVWSIYKEDPLGTFFAVGIGGIIVAFAVTYWMIGWLMKSNWMANEV